MIGTSPSARAAARARALALPLDHLDPADPQGFVDDTVGYVFERLRREDPVHRSHSPVPGIDTYWSVTRYQDIMQVDSHHELYSSVELTRFSGHLMVRYGGVRDGVQEYPVYTGV